jgi:hypothetical protein
MSHNATISTPSMYVNLLTASEPRMPNPITATRTIGIGSHARRKTSCCPFGRFGFLVFIICEEAFKEMLANRTNNERVLMLLNDDKI